MGQSRHAPIIWEKYKQNRTQIFWPSQRERCHVLSIFFSKPSFISADSGPIINEFEINFFSGTLCRILIISFFLCLVSYCSMVERQHLKLLFAYGWFDPRIVNVITILHHNRINAWGIKVGHWSLFSLHCSAFIAFFRTKRDILMLKQKTRLLHIFLNL